MEWIGRNRMNNRKIYDGYKGIGWIGRYRMDRIKVLDAKEGLLCT